MLQATSPWMLLVLNYTLYTLTFYPDAAQTHEYEVITNGTYGQGYIWGRKGFSTAVHWCLHEHMKNHWYIVLS